jgi:hypothetical protein
MNMKESTNPRLNEIAAEWREARRIYPIYAALISRFDLPLTPCRLLDSPVDRSDDESVEYVREWLQGVDESVEALQLRQILQSTKLGTEASMRSLAKRYLAKPNAADTYRDRIEFLLAQYFSLNAPASAARGIVNHVDVSRALEPILGVSPAAPPSWLKELDELLSRLEKFRSLRDFLTGGTLEQGRVLKSRYSGEFLEPAVLAAITRYNFLVRLNFIRLLHHDLERIQRVTKDLQQRGVTEIDCSAAGLSKTASPEEVLRFSANWKAIFRKDYSERQVSTAVVKILDACEQKLRSTPEVDVPIADVAEVKEVPVAAAVETAPIAFKIPPPTPAISPATIQAAESELKHPQPRKAEEKPHFAMYEVQESMFSQLTSANLQNSHLATSTVSVGDCKVLLSSWEVTAFLKGDNDVADTLQQAVVARGIVAEAVERHKAAGSAPDLKAVLALGRAEAARLQEGIAQARDARNIDAAVNLAATQKRLLQILEEAAKLQES